MVKVASFFEYEKKTAMLRHTREYFKFSRLVKTRNFCSWVETGTAVVDVNGYNQLIALTQMFYCF